MSLSPTQPYVLQWDAEVQSYDDGHAPLECLRLTFRNSKDNNGLCVRYRAELILGLSAPNGSFCGPTH